MLRCAEAAGRSIFHAEWVGRVEAKRGQPNAAVSRCFAALSMTTLKGTRHDWAWSFGDGLERRMRAGVAAYRQVSLLAGRSRSMKEQSQVGDTLCHRPSGNHCHAEAAGRSIFHAKRFDSAGSPIVRLSGCFVVPRPQTEASFTQNWVGRVKAKRAQPNAARAQMLRCAQHDNVKKDPA